MDKDINYKIEYFAKSGDATCSMVLDFLDKQSIYVPTKFDSKKIKILAKRDGIELSKENFLKLVESKIHTEIINAKKMLFKTIIQSNFKKEKEQFDKVETTIYKCLKLYIDSLCFGFELFYIYKKNHPLKPEIFILFAKELHAKIFQTIFNKEERELLKDKLQEVMGVYLTLYARYLYV
jgi:hypothetical protein